ncbi:MAG: nucleotide sugar dehydrogenase [Bacteroidales bacterium]|jgi:UDP-N-acetyl-D-mannosaminuronic acid dehydrogenase|nr:nucleotide sugar dehydrogenase [Bacteroidales bacterium]
MGKVLLTFSPENWKVEKIGVIGPGIVGMPMAAMLAHARIKIGTDKPAKVIVVQRKSINSGWKVDAIKSGKSVIGGIEPGLNDIVKESVSEGVLSATHDFNELSDADVILVSVQTDKKGFEPDYGPMFGALESLGEALRRKPAGKIPLVIFESTLAPTSMDTLIREHFKKFGLEEGKDILLGNSPNRVMPGRLVERIQDSDKLAGGLHPESPKLISKLYNYIVTKGAVLQSNSLTAEIVKTLENAYRDVRIAFSSEVVRYCDKENIDFFSVRDEVNSRLLQADNASADPNAVPSGGILVPMLGVGGHCLPKDGILLWWRNIESGTDTSYSLILNSRIINDESPVYALRHAEKRFGSLKGEKIALLGVAYRFNSEDSRNSPTLTLANYLRENNYSYIMHDPYVKKDDQNLLRFNQDIHFTSDLDEALQDADYVFMCTAHKNYIEKFEKIASFNGIKGLMDACNIYSAKQFSDSKIDYAGIGRGALKPDNELIDFVFESFRVMGRGLANELAGLIDFYNSNYAFDDFNKVKFSEVQKLARTCSTGCEIADVGKIESIPEYNGFNSILVKCAFEAQSVERRT